MQHVEVVRTIPVPPAKLWPLIADVVAIERWHPSVERADLLSEQSTGLGAARRCNFYDGTSVREEVIALDEGRRVRLAMSEFSIPMTQLEAEITLTPDANGGTKASFAIHYVVKWGLLGRLMGATVMPGQLGKMAARVLAGLAHHGATGELVGKDFVAKAA
jgi:uncharacterized protein YndB with AHSA1/START domain